MEQITFTLPFGVVFVISVIVLSFVLTILIPKIVRSVCNRNAHRREEKEIDDVIMLPSDLDGLTKKSKWISKEFEKSIRHAMAFGDPCDHYKGIVDGVYVRLSLLLAQSRVYSWRLVSVENDQQDRVKRMYLTIWWTKDDYNCGRFTFVDFKIRRELLSGDLRREVGSIEYTAEPRFSVRQG